MTYIVEFELKVKSNQVKKLNKSFEIARFIYNACLSKCLKNYKRLTSNKRFIILYKNRDKTEQEKVKMYELIDRYGLNRNYINNYVKFMQRKFKHFIGSQEAQKVSERALVALLFRNPPN